jgi:hypothetical protein
MPQDLYVRVLESNETADLGSYKKTGESIEIDHALLWMNCDGTPGGSETLVLKVYGSTSAESPIFSSDVVTLSEIDFSFDATNGDWVGRVPFVFDRQSLLMNQKYYFKLTMANYTRNADTYYLGFVMDNPEPIHSRAAASRTAARLEIVEYSD